MESTAYLEGIVRLDQNIWDSQAESQADNRVESPKSGQVEWADHQSNRYSFGHSLVDIGLDTLLVVQTLCTLVSLA